MPLNSISRNVNVTLLCITNTPTMLYAACPEKGSFHSGGRGGVEWGTRPPLSEFSASAPALRRNVNTSNFTPLIFTFSQQATHVELSSS